MTTAAITYRGAQKVSSVFPATARIPWKLLVAVQAIVCISLIAFYLVQANHLTRDTYLMQNSQKQLDSLSQENAQLQTEFANAGALSTVQQRAEALGFVKTDSFVYVPLSQDSALAAAR